MSIPNTDDQPTAMRGNWQFYAMLGTLMILLGIFAIAAPFIVGVALSFLLGVALVAGAVVHIASVVSAQSTGGFVTNLLLAIVYLLAGLALLLYPLAGLAVLTLFLAVFFLVEGAVKIVGAFEMRRYAHWGWYLFSGIVSVVLAALIWTGWPTTALWVVGVLLGVDLIGTGLAMVALAATLRGGYGSAGRGMIVGQH